MWSRLGLADRTRGGRAWGIGLVAALALSAAACSSQKKAHAGHDLGAPISRRIDPVELVPADLDVVVRIDMARMRAGLGPLATSQIAARALEGRGDAMLPHLIECADVLWLALRFADLDAADHIAIIEGKECDVHADTSDWKKVKAANRDLTIFDRLSAAKRDGTGRVILVGDRAVMLVSPAEIASVDRVLRDGPDDKRCEPKAEGIVSLDARGHSLPPELERRYPSIGSLLAGIERVKATTDLGEGLDLEAEVKNKTPHDAERTLKFLTTLRDNTEGATARAVLGGLKFEQVDSTVRAHWKVPSKIVLDALTQDPATATKP